MNKVKLFISSPKNIKKFLFMTIVIFIILRIPSLFESFWYGDEGIYAAVGRGLHDGKILYAQIWDHKPPLMFWIYYLAGFLNWNIGIVIVKALSILSGVTSIILLFKILHKLVSKTWIINLSILFFTIFLGLPILESNIANSEVFFITINLGIFYLLLKDKHMGLIGLLTFVSFLAKPQSFLEASFLIVCYLCINLKQKNSKLIIRSLIYIALGFFIPLLIYIISLFIQGTLYEFYETVFITNFAYSGLLDNALVFLGLTFNPKVIKITLFLGVFVFTLFGLIKKQTNKETFFIINIVNIEVFCCLISGRNYAHYIIQALPGFTLLFAYILTFMKRKLLLRNISLIMLFIIILNSFLTTFSKGQELEIYSKIYGKSEENYYLTFINRYILRTNGSFFRWSDGDDISRVKDFANYFNNNYSNINSYYAYTANPWLFTLINFKSTNKYVVWYHVGFTNEKTQEEIINRNKAQYFVLDTTTDKVNDFFTKLDNFVIVDEHNGFNIYQNISLNL